MHPYRKLFLVTAMVLVGAVFAAPIAQATAVTYDFTVEFLPDAQYGPLAGTVEHGTFAYDSSIIAPGSGVYRKDLFTSLQFTHNGIAYDASNTSTDWLSFDSGGGLDAFHFGTGCGSINGFCTLAPGTNDWATGGVHGFYYATPTTSNLWWGDLTFALAPYNPPVPVPESGTLGLFGFGLLLLGMAGWRRVSGGRMLGAMP